MVCKARQQHFFINRGNEIIWKTSSSDKADPRFELALQAITKNK